MSLDRDNIIRLFSLYSGEDTEPEDSRSAFCRRLCEEAAARAERSLTGGDGLPEEETALLEQVCAAEAFYRLCLTDDALLPETVTAEGVTIRRGSKAAAARALLDERLRDAAHVTDGGEMYFGAI